MSRLIEGKRERRLGPATLKGLQSLLLAATGRPARIKRAHRVHSMEDMAEGGIGRRTMNIFAIAAGMMAVIHLLAGWQRPRPAVIVSGILWLLFAVYERLVATGVLCDADCNIRVDLVFFFPILGLATFCAYQSYMGRPGQAMVVGTVLGVIGLVVFALVLESFGYAVLSGVAIAGALALGVYAVKSIMSNRSRPPRSNRARPCYDNSGP